LYFFIRRLLVGCFGAIWARLAIHRKFHKMGLVDRYKPEPERQNRQKRPHVMNEEPIKICSDCGAEYSPEAVTCADCGGTLVFPREYEKRSVPLEEEEAQTLIREGSAPYLRELGELMKKTGIRTDIRFHGCAPGT
jgi:ribosomal protein L40E